MYSHPGFYVDSYIYDVLHPESKTITLCKNLIIKPSVSCSIRRVMLHLLRQVTEARDETEYGNAQKLTQPLVRQPVFVLDS